VTNTGLVYRITAGVGIASYFFTYLSNPPVGLKPNSGELWVWGLLVSDSRTQSMDEVGSKSAKWVGFEGSDGRRYVV